MKSKIFTLFAAMLLFGAKAMAQIEGEDPKNRTEFESNGIHYIFLDNGYYGTEGLCVWVTSTAGWSWADDEVNTYSGDIVIPSTVNYNGVEYPVVGLYKSAFKGCTINSLTLSEGVKYILPYNFGNCFEETHIKAIYLPSTFTIKGEKLFLNEVNGCRVFYGCIGLEIIKVAEGNPEFDSRENCNALIETATNTLWDGCDSTVIPSSVETIGAMAFMGSGIEECIIPEGVKKVEGSAFGQCSNLKKVTFPQSTEVVIGTTLFVECTSLTTVEIPQTALIRSGEGYETTGEETGSKVIASSMFKGCTSLKDFIIPENVTRINTGAFNGCSRLESVTIPSSVANIGGLAFNRCESLNSVILLGEVPPTVASSSFKDLYEQVTLTVPEGCKELYKSTEGWNQFATILEQGETPEQTQITAISELSNTVLYAVSQPNHSKGATSWAVQEDGQALKSNHDLGLSVYGADARQQFAFVSNDDGTTLYLYHAAEAKFVGKDGSLSDKPVDAIQFKAGAYDNTFVAYFDGAHYINVGGSRQMIIDGWNTADGGNSCVITPVGEFDPTEALALIKAFETGVEMTTDNGQQTTVIYDLQGRRVEKVVKGIYIINGKKVVIK